MRSRPIFFSMSVMLLFLSLSLPAFASATASDARFDKFKPSGAITSEVEAVINSILERDKNSKASISISDIAPLLEYMLVADGSGGESAHPDKRGQGIGIYWHGVLGKPFAQSLRYFYNPHVPSELLYPASIRRGHWLPGSDILKLEKPLWQLAEGLGDQPVMLTGTEMEEITPDDFSGCYYSYELSRLLVLLRYKGVPMLLSVSWQKDKSNAGMKSGFLGKYDNWDFIYTKDVGGTASGIGWMSTYMYSSAAITLILPRDAGSTGYSMFKWLKAGWAGLNVVKHSNITSGSDRNFRGMLAVINGEKGVRPEELEEISKKYDAYARAAMLAEAKPYAEELAKLSKNDEILNRDEFQAVLANGVYAEKLADDDLRSLLKLLALKRKLGKPVLGDKL